MVFVIACGHNRPVYQPNVQVAFLQSKINKDAYVKTCVPQQRCTHRDVNARSIPVTCCLVWYHRHVAAEGCVHSSQLRPMRIDTRSHQSVRHPHTLRGRHTRDCDENHLQNIPKEGPTASTPRLTSERHDSFLARRRHGTGYRG